jgi:hypothetical protein
MQMPENGTADDQQFIKNGLARYVALVAPRHQAA